jgi:hypothetical protein
MKLPPSLFPLVTIASLLVATTCLGAAQEKTKDFESRDAHVTLHSGQPEMRDFGPPPAFDQIDQNHDGSITPAEAKSGYEMLYIDFEFADHNRNGRVSRAEYEHWIQHGEDPAKR